MKVHFEHIYEHIGYLFYAIACEHGKLNAVKFDKLKRVVDQQWRSFGNGVAIESNLANYLQAGVRNAYDTKLTSQEAFDLFKNYHDIHCLPFGGSMTSKIIAIASKIASEFSGNWTKSEFISTLKNLLAVNSIVP